jgi:hypothetical protein
MSVYHVRSQVLDPQMGSVIFVCDFVDLRPHVFGVSSTGATKLFELVTVVFGDKFTNFLS